ncbi:MAG: FAD:protein transferase [Gemmatimonadetes bacterium]|nr:FAD:protein transferase [Gemmatimonadota bacterium]
MRGLRTSRSLAALGTTPWRHALALLVVLIAFAARTDAQVRSEFSELHMGVEVRIVMYARDERQARKAARAAFDRFAALEDIMSDYRPKSEIRSLDRRAGEWVAVSEPLFTVLERAVEIARATDGAFDPTVGPLVALWREARRVHRLPGDTELDSARAHAGWRHIALDSVRRRARLEKAGMHLDLGGIAKGYAVQQAIKGLRAQGVMSALVEAGGDIAVSDAPPGKAGWCVDVPGADESVRARAAALTNASISTSGPSAQFVEIGGVRYSHVIDPRTGLGLTSGVQATVIATDGALADALSTALTVLPREAVRSLLARYLGVIASVTREER